MDELSLTQSLTCAIGTSLKAALKSNPAAVLAFRHSNRKIRTADMITCLPAKASAGVSRCNAQTRVRLPPRGAQPGALGCPRSARRLLHHLLAVLWPVARGSLPSTTPSSGARWQDQGPRHRPRPGALVAGPVRQDPRPALAVPGGNPAGPLRRAALTIAL